MILRRSDVLAGTPAGLAGTAVMTATLALESRLRRRVDGPVDYDASPHVVTAAATVLHLHPRTAEQRRALFLLVHWGYGSAVATLWVRLRRALGSDARATVAFWAACQTMAFVLFPLAGGTPPPWRWRRDVLASSLLQHAGYAVTVAAVGRRTAGPQR